MDAGKVLFYFGVNNLQWINPRFSQFIRSDENEHLRIPGIHFSRRGHLLIQLRIWT
jgi:hypothetical protein